MQLCLAIFFLEIATKTVPLISIKRMIHCKGESYRQVGIFCIRQYREITCRGGHFGLYRRNLKSVFADFLDVAKNIHSKFLKFLISSESWVARYLVLFYPELFSKHKAISWKTITTIVHKTATNIINDTFCKKKHFLFKISLPKADYLTT